MIPKKEFYVTLIKVITSCFHFFPQMITIFKAALDIFSDAASLIICVMFILIKLIQFFSK